ncbi:hypothetical protein [Desulfovibrio inopinatus]|uniref:hypothetical protein n=1 Tax=Desulfovibrio inopinatus TaxID=102109 RepID=UPI0004181F08|nr:hypothetical protein [Desulfovibrio inopinatus]
MSENSERFIVRDGANPGGAVLVDVHDENRFVANFLKHPKKPLAARQLAERCALVLNDWYAEWSKKHGSES